MSSGAPGAGGVALPSGFAAVGCLGGGLEESRGAVDLVGVGLCVALAPRVPWKAMGLWGSQEAPSPDCFVTGQPWAGEVVQAAGPEGMQVELEPQASLRCVGHSAGWSRPQPGVGPTQ